MRNTVLAAAMIALALCSASASGAEHPELGAFPPAKDGMERFVIVLPHKERGEEDNFQVEIIVGKDMLTDGVNRVRLGNTIEPRPLPGWGYTYYEVTGPAATMSTMMAPPPGAPMVRSFVTGTPLLVRYNSRLPIVVYVPTGYEVRYRIWQAPGTAEKAEKG
jgi:ecotin